MSSWCPPLFDKDPKRVTKRLFLYASDAIADMLRKKFKIAGYVTQDYEYMAHMAWLIGGASAAQALIRQVRCVKTAWGSGDDEKTLGLIKVCTMHMISWWFRNLEGRPDIPDEARGMAHESAASSMIGVINRLLCGRDGEVPAMTTRDLGDFVTMDRQWKWQNEWGGDSSTYAALLLAEALQACGQRLLEWGRVMLSIESVKQLCDSGTVLEPRCLQEVDTFAKVLACMDEGVRAAKRYHEMNMDGRLQPPEKG